MPNNITINFQNNNVDFKDYDLNSNTLNIKDCNGDTYFLNFDGFIPNHININIINSSVTIIENYYGKLDECKFIINIDQLSNVNRFSIIVDTTNNQCIDREVNNNGSYQSMQIDLTAKSLVSNENINLTSENASALIIDGIYAINNANKKYQTNLNHYSSNCNSKAQIFAINNDSAHVSIFTDAYIKNKAVGSKTNQEGRIINLSSTCSGIVLPNLHIDENDVEASHSCSVGSVNQDHIYYLESRGLSALQARNILIRGYFNPILENITNENIKEEINKVLDKRIG